MYVVAIPNHGSRPTILLRESYREGKQVKNRTLANLTHWEPWRVEALQGVLRGRVSSGSPLEEAFEVVATRPHGHVVAVVGTMRRLGLGKLLGATGGRARDMCLAMVASRLLRPDSKLATARGLSRETKTSTLGEVLGVESVREDDLYAAMDWLLGRQARIEEALSKRHLGEGDLVLYDVTSTYFEGRHCPLAYHGHSRDDKPDLLQIVFGLLTNAEGCPVSVEVFDGNTSDPKTLKSQIQKVRERFGLRRLVIVGDRGMITEARIREDLSGAEGLDWITALRAPAIAGLVKRGSLQLGLFDERDLGEIADPAYPGERLVVCRNPLLAQERARKRRDLLDATEKRLSEVVTATTRTRNPLRGREAIALRVGKVLGRYKVGKHFRLHIDEDPFRFERDEEKIACEAALDGIYVLRTTVGADRMSTEETVRSYKRLSKVERAFRSLKSVDLHVRPIHHHKADRVRAHVLLCMLAYYVEWHMRRALAPVLFDDADPEAGEALRPSVVAPARRSPEALDKASTKRTDKGQPVHSFQTLLEDLATLAKNRIQPKNGASPPFDVITTPSASQKKALELLQVDWRM